MTDESAGPDDPPGVGLDRHRADEAIYQPFSPGPIPWTRGEDGLPMPSVPTDMPIVPPLNPATMVCIADHSAYVVRNKWGEIVRRYSTDRVTRATDGRYYVRVLWLFRRVVEPVRPQCRHLKRQMVDFQDAAENQFLERLCTARRDSESFFLSVRDQQVHACEMREPRDGLTELRLDRFDAAKLRLGKERYTEGGVFDVDAALKRTEEEADHGLRIGGIFKE